MGANDSVVHSCFLDASNVFDHNNHTVLLLKMNFSPDILHTLLSWYSEQRVSVYRNNLSSEKYKVSNGVRQVSFLLF